MANQSVTIKGPVVSTSTPDGTVGDITANGTISASHITSSSNIGIGTSGVISASATGGIDITTSEIHTSGSLTVAGSAGIDGNLSIGPKGGQLYVFGPSATVNAETTESVRLVRPSVGGVKNTNSAGLFVGAFETGIDGRSQLDIKVAGTPGNSNTWGYVPDVKVMSLRGDGNVMTDGNLKAGSITTGSISASVNDGNGLTASSSNTFGVQGTGGNAGVAAFNSTNTNAAYLASGCCAAWFTGGVYIGGDATVAGLLKTPHHTFNIDHPNDHANKYLTHSLIGSSEMKNLYDGTVVLDANGDAVVELPDWFASLNADFRYQLTPIGAPGPNLYIAEEIANNHFKIAGGVPSMKVSWQVTAVRQDAWANAHPLEVETEKSAEERGYFLYPELYGASREQSIELLRQPKRGALTLPNEES